MCQAYNRKQALIVHPQGLKAQEELEAQEDEKGNPPPDKKRKLMSAAVKPPIAPQAVSDNMTTVTTPSLVGTAVTTSSLSSRESSPPAINHDPYFSDTDSDDSDLLSPILFSPASTTTTTMTKTKTTTALTKKTTPLPSPTARVVTAPNSTEGTEKPREKSEEKSQPKSVEKLWSKSGSKAQWLKSQREEEKSKSQSKAQLKAQSPPSVSALHETSKSTPSSPPSDDGDDEDLEYKRAIEKAMELSEQEKSITPKSPLYLGPRHKGRQKSPLLNNLSEYQKFFHNLEEMYPHLERTIVESTSLIRGANGRQKEGAAGLVKNQYGRVKDEALLEILKFCGINEIRNDQIFLDIGSGIGNAVYQMALMYGCESRGIEINKDRHDIAGVAVSCIEEYNKQLNKQLKHPLRPGKISLVHGHIEDENHFNFITEADFVFVNNYEEVFKKSSEHKGSTGYTRYSDYHVAALFSQMKVGTVMITMCRITELGHSKEQIDEALQKSRIDVDEIKERVRDKNCEEVVENLSFFSEEIIPTSMEFGNSQPFTWSGKLGNTYKLYKYTRLDQRAGQSGLPLRTWVDPDRPKDSPKPPPGFDSLYQRPHQLRCKNRDCIELALSGEFPMVLFTERLTKPNPKAEDNERVCTMIGAAINPECELCGDSMNVRSTRTTRK
ncbi:hypothetical protein TrST_g692 [Triparma strigata]|uniref:Histone-lysine N-methyltransferase, H3 lysine-79 specific n=1 Tax=Triparma strigata TaxID=1606541 RepID=A0A9W7B534_9STRA|nr:hypothetical protein TrST_g692 [Triparma strigata]